MSHDTDKLIRQLSLVAFLMAERRALTARDVKSNVEGYSEMSDEAFARRYYSDRAELVAQRQSVGEALDLPIIFESYVPAESPRNQVVTGQGVSAFGLFHELQFHQDFDRILDLRHLRARVEVRSDQTTCRRLRRWNTQAE